MTVQGQLLDMLEAVAAALGDELRARLVFVGGCSTALLISDDNILEDIRATDDVDLIVDLAGRVQWYQLVEELQPRGFTISAEDGPTCRLLLGDLKVDFMPLDGNILGFSNRWYKKAIATAIPRASQGRLGRLNQINENRRALAQRAPNWCSSLKPA